MPAVVAEQLPRPSIPSIPAQLPSIPDTIALGIQAKVLFKGLILNDRLRPDRYVLTNIEGLGGAELRDVRQPRPAAHGEIPYDAYWGGKTLTFEGVMEAFSLQELSRMERDLRAALGSLEESPMKFNWWDVYDDFTEPTMSKAFWRTLLGTGVTIPGDGTLNFASAGGGVSYYALRQYIDQVVSVKLVVMEGEANAFAGVVTGATTSESLLQLQLVLNVNKGVMAFVLESVTTAGTVELLKFSVPGTAKNGTHYWIQLQVTGDTLEIRLYESDPFLSSETVAIVAGTYVMEGELATTFGMLKSGFAGLRSTNNKAFLFEDFHAEGVWPCDFSTEVKPIAQPIIKNAAQPKVDRYRREFQFAVRTADPHWQAPKSVIASTNQLSGGPSGLLLGRVFPRVFPSYHNVLINEAGERISESSTPHQFVVVNRGNWEALPIVIIQGGITNPVLSNLTTGESFILNGTIAPGESVIAEAAKKLLFNKQGANVFSIFAVTSEWPRLAPGDNVFTFSGQSPVETPSVLISWRHTWF